MNVDSFQFVTAAKIVFGRGSAVAQLDGICKQYAPEGGVFVVRGSSSTTRDEIKAVLDSIRGKICGEYILPSGEPTIASAERGTEIAKQAGARAVVAIGGGSVMDAGKAIAALTANGGAVLDYIEVIGRGNPLKVPALPVIAIPTTAGTGAEVTKNAVLMSPEHGVKASMRSETMLPRVAIVDPVLTDNCPEKVTIASGLDALTQCIEPYVSCIHNPITDALCLSGIEHAARALSNMKKDKSSPFKCSPSDRDDMCIASLFGGICLANAKLGIVHGIAGPLGGMIDNAPHGALCGAILPYGMRTNVSVIRDPSTEIDDIHRKDYLERYRRVAIALTGRQEATIDEGLSFVENLVKNLDAPGLAKLGLKSDKIDELITKSLRASSTKGNAIPLTPDQTRKIINDAM